MATTISAYQIHCSFSGKEKDSETGYHYFGARYYNSDLSLWLSVDPMSDKYPSLSPYNYCAWNPMKLVDPDGQDISTHTDENGNVVAVYNDGDNNVYRHSGDRKSTLSELESKYNTNNTSAGGVKMGKTKYWDEFMTHDNKTGEPLSPYGKIHFGESWESVISSYNGLSMQVGLEATAVGSLNKGLFDIKVHSEIAPDGPMTGKLLNGYYASAESAGNFLAGLNGATSRGMFGQHISLETFLSLAGALHSYKNGTSRDGIYKGEIPYAGRNIVEGFKMGLNIRNGL